MIPRIFDVSKEPQTILAAVDGYQNAPLLPLDIAVHPLIPFFEPGTLERNVWIAIERCRSPLNNLTVDESASIALFTMSWVPENQSLYYLLNQTLRMEQRNKLVPWYNYLKLFFTALHRLPRVRSTVLRGVKIDISSKYTEGNCHFWWGLSSCTSSMKLMESPQFCGQEGPRTIFFIHCESARRIQQHSMFENEEEIILLPGFYFEVKGTNNLGNGLHFVELIEKQPPHVILPLPERLGIYIEGVCLNDKCSVYKRQIRNSFGYCTLNILLDLDEKNCKCPLCLRYVEPKKVGFINCWWRYSAAKKEGPSIPAVSVSKDWEYADGPTYLSSNGSEDSKVSWLKLIIEAKEGDPPNKTENQRWNASNNQQT